MSLKYIMTVLSVSNEVQSDSGAIFLRMEPQPGVRRPLMSGDSSNQTHRRTYTPMGMKVQKVHPDIKTKTHRTYQRTLCLIVTRTDSLIITLMFIMTSCFCFVLLLHG